VPKLLRCVFAGLLCANLSGCFFVFIPGSLISKAADAMSGEAGDNCIVEGAKVGDILKTDAGESGTVVAISGKSSRCTDPRRPIRATVTMNKT
jgi:hypothetical protein